MANASAGHWRLQKAERFMNAATRAFDAGDYETAVSRAYYAAYHALIAAFETKMGVTRRRWSHNLRPYFSRYPDLDDLRRPLIDLYEARATADYEDMSFASDTVEDVISLAQTIVNRAVEVVGDGQV